MPLYLTRFSYTPETWNAMIERPEDRRDIAREIIESVGGRLQGFWYAFGQYDGYTLGKRLTMSRWRLSPLPFRPERLSNHKRRLFF
jgi:hypothetical protein